ncbi:hypothetical protein L1987_20503 [Smallanthus sonchifolius]|uniref:Uncharacterized protein n=1 Tax=Smallanthus sonchifolius TaxID=185202 RepID=A0ACB9ITR1_9ASTR|nr:hypothetical protein L1987_20503 [Smallanthus sonchifolius]
MPLPVVLVLLDQLIVIEDRTSLNPNHCIGRSVIGEAKDLSAMSNIRSLLTNGGYDKNPSLYVGGLKVLIVFKERTIAMNFMENESNLWKKACVSVSQWEGDSTCVVI